MNNEVSTRTKWLIFFSLLGTFLINIELTAVNLALSQIAHHFHISIGQTSGILSYYLAMFSVFTIVGGRLGDLFGRRNISITMLVIFIVSSILGGIAKSYTVLLLSRALQGLSAGALLPNLTAILYASVSDKNRSKMIGSISAVVGFATSAGPLIGAFISHYWGWRAIFFLNVPIALAVTVPLAVLLPAVIQKVRVKLDWFGMLITIFAVVLLLQLIKQIPKASYQSMAIGGIVIVVISVVWLLQHLRSNTPFISIHLFRLRSFATGCLLRLFLGIAYYSILFVLGIYAQNVLHLPVASSGALYLPMTISVTIASLCYGKLYKHFNVARLLQFSLFIFSSALLAFSLDLGSITPVIVALVLLGLSYGVMYATLFSVTLSEVHKDNTSEASGSLYFFNLLGGSVGVCIAGIIFHYNQKINFQMDLTHGICLILFVTAGLNFLGLIISFISLPKNLFIIS